MTKRIVRENAGDELYEYSPLGKYVVSKPVGALPLAALPLGVTVPTGLGFGVPVAPHPALSVETGDLSGSWRILARLCPVL